MKNVLENRPMSLHLYYQYRDNAALEEYFEIMHAIITEYYYDFVATTLNELNISKARTDYLAFWSLNMLGLHKPLGAASLNVFYDIGEKFDALPPLVYDDAQDYDGTVGLTEFKQYLRFILDYSNEVISIPVLCEFAQNWGKFDSIRDVAIESTNDGIVLKIPTTQQSGEFLKLLRAYYNELGLPFGSTVDIRYKDERLNRTILSLNT